MGLRDKIQKKFQETLTVRHRRERPSSVPPPKKQSVGGASSPNFSSPQDESLHRTGRRMSTGNAGIPEAPLPVSEPNLTAPMLISPKGSLTGELGEAAVPPSPGSPTSVVSVPHVMLSVEDIPSLSVTGSVSLLCSETRRFPAGTMYHSLTTLSAATRPTHWSRAPRPESHRCGDRPSTSCLRTTRRFSNLLKQESQELSTM